MANLTIDKATLPDQGGTANSVLDRRGEQRYRLNNQVMFRTDSGTFLQVTALNFSLNGMGLVCPQEYDLGTTCQVTYSHPNLGLNWVEGIVSFCQPLEEGFSIGLRLQFRSLADRSPYQEIVLSSG